MPKKYIKDRLTRFRENFFREKYRFDQGNAFLVFLNFSLLVISLSHQLNANSNSTVYYIIGGLASTWLLGYFLDKVVKVQDIQERVVLQRSPIWKDVFAKHDQEEKHLTELINRLEKLERRFEKLEEKLEKKELKKEKLD